MQFNIRPGKAKKINEHVETEKHAWAPITAAIHLLMVYMLKIRMARVESKNAARLQSRVTAAINNKYTLHRCRNLGWLELARAAEVMFSHTLSGRILIKHYNRVI